MGRVIKAKKKKRWPDFRSWSLEEIGLVSLPLVYVAGNWKSGIREGSTCRYASLGLCSLFIPRSP